MQAIILNNQIKLVDDSSFINATIRVPARNLQEMIKLTGAKILKKEEERVTFNHYAGTLYKVTVYVAFKRLSPYLGHDSVYDCENKENYLSLFIRRDRLYYTDTNLKSEKVGLYAFGQSYVFEKNNCNVIYFGKSGKKISLNHSPENDFGKKRMVKFKGEYVSNRRF